MASAEDLLRIRKSANDSVSHWDGKEREAWKELQDFIRKQKELEDQHDYYRDMADGARRYLLEIEREIEEFLSKQEG